MSELALETLSKKLQIESMSISSRSERLYLYLQIFWVKKINKFETEKKVSVPTLFTHSIFQNIIPTKRKMNGSE